MNTGRVGLVLFSHSRTLAAGAVELVSALGGADDDADGNSLRGVGGLPDGGLGTDADGLTAAIVAVEQGRGVLVVPDLGSAVLTAQLVCADLGADVPVRIADTPFVEGAVAAGALAAAGASLQDLLDATDEARGISKFG